MYLECKAKRIFDELVLVQKLCVLSVAWFFFKKIINIDLKMGGTPFGRQDFSVLSLPPPLVVSPVFSSRSCLGFSRSSLARVSRSLARLLLVSRSLALSRSCLALSRSSLASVFWLESMMCVYDI